MSSVVSLTENNMSAALKLLLLAAGTLLVSAQSWNNYRSLPDLYRTHIDKALKDANGKFGQRHHVAYERILSTPRFTDSTWNVNVRLVVTECKKKGFEHRDECVTRKPKTPWINCLVCKPESGEELIDCVRQADVQKRKDARAKCSVYHHGGGTLLFQKSEKDGPETGCLGCV